MQGKHEYQPELFSQIDYEHLIPKGHLLRRIDQVLDLAFLPELTKPLYANAMGRPSIDPVVFVRMVLLGYLYNVDSDRQLCEEVGYNLAYRWFCRLSLKDRVPDHSSITRIRDRLGEMTYERIFKEVVGQCRKAGLVKLEQVMIDGSVIRANASIYGMQEREEKKRDDDDSTPPPAGGAHAHSKDGLSVNDFRKKGIGGKKISNQTHFNPADPEATLTGKAGENKSLAYKTHTAIDAGSRVVVDCHVTTGSVSDVTMLQSRIEAIAQSLDLKIGELIADRGYGSAENLDYLEKRGIEANIPLWSTRSGETLYKELEEGFRIDDGDKGITCPEGHRMKLSFREHVSSRNAFTLPRSVCMACPRANTCLSEYEQKNRGKKVMLSDFYKIWMATIEKQKEPEFKRKLWQRMWKMEGIFAEAKSHHGMRRARYRGRAKMQIQVYMTSTVQNLKRLAGSILYWLRCVLVNLESRSQNPKTFRQNQVLT